MNQQPFFLYLKKQITYLNCFLVHHTKILIQSKFAVIKFDDDQCKVLKKIAKCNKFELHA